MFSRELIALFVELENTPVRQRGQEWQAGSKRLAGWLGLTSEWWSTNHVNDRMARPCWPRGHYAYSAFYRCRAVRRRLIEEATAALAQARSSSPVA
jgi:hypothetical protein